MFLLVSLADCAPCSLPGRGPLRPFLPGGEIRQGELRYINACPFSRYRFASRMGEASEFWL